MTLMVSNSSLSSVIVLTLASIAVGQGIEGKQPDPELRELARATRGKSKMPTPPSGVNVEATEEVVKSWNEWQKFVYDNGRRTFWFQFVSSVIILAAVHAVLVFSLVLTWRHFRRGTEPAGEQTSHEISIGKDGLSVRSPVIGLAVLALSLGFFYLYLRHVYPVNFVQW